MCRITERTTDYLLQQISGMTYISFSDSYFMILLLVMMKLKDYGTNELLLALVQRYSAVYESAPCLLLRCVVLLSFSYTDSLHHPFRGPIESDHQGCAESHHLQGNGKGKSHSFLPGEAIEESCQQLTGFGNHLGGFGVARFGRLRGHGAAEALLVSRGVPELLQSVPLRYT
mgnify:FL=1